VNSAEDEAPAEVAFVLRLGRALHTHGYPAPLLEGSLTKVANRFGLESQFFSTPTSLFCSFGRIERQQTFLLRVEPGEVNLGILTQLHRLIGEELETGMGAALGLRRLAEIVAAPAPYPRWLTTVSHALASGGAALFLGGGFREFAIASILGLGIGVLGLLAGWWPKLKPIFEPLAAFAVALCAHLLAHAWAPASVFVVTLAGLIVLVPGFTLTVALTELATRHWASGTARLAGAAALFLTIGFGVALGGRLGTALVGPAGVAPGVVLLTWTEWVAMLLAPLSFTVLLRAELRDAGWILLTGMLAAISGRIGAQILGPELGMFLAAVVVGVASNVYSRLLSRPAAVTLVPGILLLVPGSIGFRSLASLMDKEVVLGVETLFRMAFVAISLVAGLLVASVVSPQRRGS
jgi:uncharacterized membrane protein YjjP (DUF1212 family)